MNTKLIENSKICQNFVNYENLAHYTYFIKQKVSLINFFIDEFTVYINVKETIFA